MATLQLYFNGNKTTQKNISVQVQMRTMQPLQLQFVLEPFSIERRTKSKNCRYKYLILVVALCPKDVDLNSFDYKYQM